MKQGLDASRYKEKMIFLNRVEHLMITCTCADDAILCACVYVRVCVCVCVCVCMACVYARVCVRANVSGFARNVSPCLSVKA